METGDYVEIKELYFSDYPNLTEAIYNKNENRVFLGLIIKVSEQLNFCIPLRSNQPRNNRVMKLGAFPIPSQPRPNACLDFTKLLIIHDEKYLKIMKEAEAKIPRSQKKIIQNNMDTLLWMARRYLKGYKRYHKERNRTAEKKQDPLYQFSTLQNYHMELGLIDEGNDK